MKVFKFSVIYLFLLFMIISNQVYAEDIGIYGVGQKYCSDFVAALDSSGLPLGKSASIQQGTAKYISEKEKFLEYAYGMLTVLNGESIQGYGDRKQVRGDLSTLLEMSLKKYCSDNPSNYFLGAVFFFRNQNAR